MQATYTVSNINFRKALLLLEDRNRGKAFTEVMLTCTLMLHTSSGCLGIRTEIFLWEHYVLSCS